tara:strand:- start:236 stop:388 length:153 start_codon:yes stop_codon:yes gene_type:complete
MNTIGTMLSEGRSINDIAAFIQEKNPSLPRKEAIETAFKFMREWKDNECA